MNALWTAVNRFVEDHLAAYYFGLGVISGIGVAILVSSVS